MNLDKITAGDTYPDQPETPKNEPHDYLQSLYKDRIEILIRKDSEDGLTIITLLIRDGDKRFKCSRKVRFQKAFYLEMEFAEAELIMEYEKWKEQKE